MPTALEIVDEITLDPVQMGYSQSDAAQIINVLHDETMRVHRKDSFTAAELFNLIDEAEFVFLGADQQAAVNRVLALSGDIDCSIGSRAHTVFQQAFGEPTMRSHQNYIRATSTTRSRAEELGWGRIRQGDVERALDHVLGGGVPL